MKPSFTIAGNAAAWGDLSEVANNMLGNLFAVSITLPKSLQALMKGGGSIISMLASAVTIPEESITVATVDTKLSNYDIAVGKERGELSVTFREMQGAPVSQIFNTWHKLIVDARNNGIGWPVDYRTEVWISALAGDGTPFYWWGFRGCFPKSRGTGITFDNGTKEKIDIPITWSYIEIIDAAEKMTGTGSNFSVNLASVAEAVGLSGT